MTTAKSIALFILAAILEIGGAWLVWQGVREHRGWTWAGLGVIGLGAYGFIATLQPDAHFGRILAAYGGIFVAETLMHALEELRLSYERYRDDPEFVAEMARGIAMGRLVHRDGEQHGQGVDEDGLDDLGGLHRAIVSDGRVGRLSPGREGPGGHGPAGRVRARRR